jgi:tetratricopeptide (TPR) repeat protein
MQRRCLLAAAALLLGCQQAPSPLHGSAAPSPSAPATVSAAAQLKAEGDALMGAGDHRGATDRYRRALALEPDEISLRFALGTAYTFLSRRPEAVEQFRSVVTRGDPGSVEYREARRWLAGAGVPIESAPTPGAAAAPAGPDSPLIGGRLVGRTEWPGIDPKVRAIGGQLSIAGIEGATENVKQSRPLRLGGSYHFYNIPPGQYRIVALMASYPEDITLWDQKVMVADGTPTELVLTPATARLSPDKYPPPPTQ